MCIVIHLYILFAEAFIQIFHSFCNWILSCESSLYILDANPLSDKIYKFIFLICVAFCFLMVAFEVQNFKFLKSSLSVFSIVNHALFVICKNPAQYVMKSWRFCPVFCFFKWSFIDFGSPNRVCDPFWVNFEYGVRSGSTFILVSLPFTDMIILSLLNCPETLVEKKISWDKCKGFLSGLSSFPLIYMLIFTSEVHSLLVSVYGVCWFIWCFSTSLSLCSYFFFAFGYFSDWIVYLSCLQVLSGFSAC